MRLSQFSIISAAVLVGFVLGLILAPSLRQTGPANASPPQGKSAATNRTSVIPDALGNSPTRIRARDREPAKKTDDPRISIPVKTMVALLQDGRLRSVGFMDLENYIERTLEPLGASKTESDDIKDLIKKSKDEIYAMEKSQFQLGLVTPDHIEIDTSGIWDAISTIRGHLQNGIRSTLKPEAAEILVSAIDWKNYYPIGEKFITSLEVTRKPSGQLMAWERSPNGESGDGVDKKFPNDGTSLPADQIFREPWKCYLKGLTLVPKDEK